MEEEFHLELGLQNEERGRAENKNGFSRSKNCNMLPEHRVNESDREDLLPLAVTSKPAVGNDARARASRVRVLSPPTEYCGRTCVTGHGSSARGVIVG